MGTKTIKLKLNEVYEFNFAGSFIKGVLIDSKYKDEYYLFLDELTGRRYPIKKESLTLKIKKQNEDISI